MISATQSVVFYLARGMYIGCSGSCLQPLMLEIDWTLSFSPAISANSCSRPSRHRRLIIIINAVSTRSSRDALRALRDVISDPENITFQPFGSQPLLIKVALLSAHHMSSSRAGSLGPRATVIRAF